LSKEAYLAPNERFDQDGKGDAEARESEKTGGPSWADLLPVVCCRWT